MGEKLWPKWTATGRLEPWVILVQVAVATVLLAPALLHPGTALPGQAGMADLPGTVNFHWLVHSQTFSELQQSTMLMYPSEMDRMLLDGMPLDALVSWPFVALLGWPAGFTVFVWFSFTILRIASAWLARGWWGHATAAAVAGVVAQTQPFLIRELVNGRPTQVFGAIFLPLCVGYALRALTHNKSRDAWFAGICWGLGTLSYWYYGAFFGLSLLCLLGLTAHAKALSLRTFRDMVAGLVAVVLGPVLYVLNSDAKIPGQGSTWDDPITHGSYTMQLRDVIEHRDLGTGILTDRIMAAQLLTLLLIGLTIKTYRRQRWFLPALWLGVSVAFAMGPRISL